MSETGPPLVIGWNYVHATNCYGYFDGSTTWLYVFPEEGGFWFTSNAALQRTLAPACQTANWVGFNVFNSSGEWNLLQTFPFR